MIKIFIGGSRKIGQLPQPVLQRIDNMINSQLTILVGDAAGVDLQVQKYLLAHNYRKVIIFCSGNTCRHNVGDWETRNVTPETHRKGFDFYAAKDLQMAQEATHGFMIWDAQSKGTLNNILNLLRLQKKALIYFAPTHSFCTVRTTDDLHMLLAQCERPAVAGFERELGLQHFFKTMQPQLHLNFLESHAGS